MAMKNEVNVGMMATIAFASAVLLVVVIVGTHAWFLSEEAEEVENKWKDSPNLALNKLRDDQTRHVANPPAVIDQQKDIYGMPIEAAMEQVVKTKGKVVFAKGAMPAPGK